MASLRFDMEAGLLMRGAVRRWLKSLAYSNHLTPKIDEDKGWLDSHFWVEMTGSDEDVAKAYFEIERIKNTLGKLEDGPEI